MAKEEAERKEAERVEAKRKAREDEAEAKARAKEEERTRRRQSAKKIADDAITAMCAAEEKLIAEQKKDKDTAATKVAESSQSGARGGKKKVSLSRWLFIPSRANLCSEVFENGGRIRLGGRDSRRPGGKAKIGEEETGSVSSE